MSPSVIVNIVLACVLAAVASYGLVRLLFRIDERVEDVKRGLIELAGKLRGLGLVKIPALLIDLAVNDFSAVVHKIGDTVRLFLDGDTAVLNEFSQVFDRLLVAQLKTEAGRALVAAKLADAALESDASIVADAPVATTK
jgi:hypothetical protein